MDYIWPKYSRSSLRTHTSSKQRQRFSVESVIQKCNPSIPLLLQRCEIGFLIREYFSCLSKMAIIYQPITVGEVERLKWTLEVGSHSTDKFPDTLHA